MNDHKGDKRDEGFENDQIAEKGDEPSRRVDPRGRLLRNGIVLLIVLLGGFLLQTWEVRRLRRTAEDAVSDVVRTQRDLEVEILTNTLAVAALYAAHGDYRPATEQAALFFDGLSHLRTRVSADHETALVAMASHRDDIIGMLATGDSIAKYQLTGLFAQFAAEMSGQAFTFTVPTGLPEELSRR